MSYLADSSIKFLLIALLDLLSLMRMLLSSLGVPSFDETKMIKKQEVLSPFPLLILALVFLLLILF